MYEKNHPTKAKGRPCSRQPPRSLLVNNRPKQFRRQHDLGLSYLGLLGSPAGADSSSNSSSSSTKWVLCGGCGAGTSCVDKMWCRRCSCLVCTHICVSRTSLLCPSSLPHAYHTPPLPSPIPLLNHILPSIPPPATYIGQVEAGQPAGAARGVEHARSPQQVVGRPPLVAGGGRLDAPTCSNIIGELRDQRQRTKGANVQDDRRAQ